MLIETGDDMMEENIIAAPNYSAPSCMKKSRPLVKLGENEVKLAEVSGAPDQTPVK
jgi:hypothetical protein